MVAAQVSIDARRIESAGADAYRHLLEAAAKETKAISAVATTSALPVMSRDKQFREVQSEGVQLMAAVTDASPSYFDVLRVATVTGRHFDGRRTDEVVINTALAGALFGSTSALGRSVSVAGDARPALVVGVISNLGTADRPDEPVPEVVRGFRSAAQQVKGRSNLVYVMANCGSSCETIAPQLLNSLRRISGVEVQRVESLSQLANVVTGPIFGRALVWLVYGALSVLIALSGTAALVSYAVASRARETQIRMALGAAPQSVLLALAGEGVLCAVFGVALGCVLVIAMQGAVQSVATFYAPAAATFVATGLALIFASAIASFLPAFAATRLSPKLLQLETGP